MRVLVVEDYPEYGHLLKAHLTSEGFGVDVASSGEEALWLARSCDYDVAVVDLWLPDMTGIHLCRTLRAEQRWMPVIVLTASDELKHCLEALDGGADDFVTKPVALSELSARIRALLRRGTTERPTELRCGELTLDPATHRVCREGVVVDLTPREFALLEYLMRHQGAVLTRTAIIEHVWDFAFQSDSNVVDVHIRSLRRKIGLPFGADLIETVRGVGYRLRAGTHDGPAMGRRRDDRRPRVHRRLGNDAT